MPCKVLLAQQLATGGGFRQNNSPQTVNRSCTTCFSRKPAARHLGISQRQVHLRQSLNNAVHRYDTQKRHAVRLIRASAASPALDNSGGDLPPINTTSKAVGEYDDDSSEGSSAAEIESVLLKVWMSLQHLSEHKCRVACGLLNMDGAVARQAVGMRSSPQTCR